MTKKELKEILQKTWDNMPEEAMGTIRLCVASYLHSFIQAIDTNPEDSKQAEDESKPEPIYAPDDMDYPEYPAFGKGEYEKELQDKLYNTAMELERWKKAARECAVWMRDSASGYEDRPSEQEIADNAELTIKELFGDDK